MNPNAIKLLSEELDKIHWSNLSQNPSTIRLLSENLDKIYWRVLSENPSPDALKLLSEDQDKIDWRELSRNLGIFNVDYELIGAQILPFKEDLIASCLHPHRFAYFLDKYNYDICSDEYY